ncbi:MAG: hypothetical protein ACD_79C00466G0009 [uncultured bacterium]|nr:MAG: hypothetical protein ACD_79C00466G0009 [uncultured bacterium]
MNAVDIVIANSLGITKSNKFIIHSPSRWSESFSLPEKHFSYYPCFMGVLSSLLKTNTPLKVKMLDGCLLKLKKEEYLDNILSLKPKYLFMEIASLVYKENLELALEIKRLLGTKILFAGPHVSLHPEQALKDGIDYVFKGEYEQSVLNFFISNKHLMHENGIFESQYFDFSNTPWPEDSDVSRMNYAIPGEPSSEYKEIQIYASRGCIGKCSFCVARNIYYKNSFVRTRQPHDVIKEMTYLKNKYPMLEGFFFDEEDHFALQDFNNLLCNELIKINNTMKIEAMGRIQSIPLHIIPKLKKAGYYKLRVGIESFDEEVQKKIGKYIPRNQIEDFLYTCKNNNISVYATFQVGLSASSPSSDLFTLSIIKDYIMKDLISNVQVSIYTPFPGTPDFQYLKDSKYLISENYEDYNGGEKSIIDRPEYSAKEVINIYNRFLIMRDHINLVKKIKTKRVFKWILSKVRKYGLKKSMYKLRQRIQIEMQYLKINKK